VNKYNIFGIYLRRYIVNKSSALLNYVRYSFAGSYEHSDKCSWPAVLPFEGRSCVKVTLKFQDGTRFWVFQISVFTTSDFAVILFTEECQWFWAHLYQMFFFVCFCIPKKMYSFTWLGEQSKEACTPKKCNIFVPFLLQFLQARRWDVESPRAFCISFYALK
jgi:hypothetical protein